MRWAVVVCLLVGAGCKPHVSLVPPPPGATPEQRVGAFNQLHAIGEKTEWSTTCRTRGGCSTTVEKTLYLANGTQVHHEEDLLPVLPPDSESAREVHAAQAARSRQLKWALAAIGGFIAGAAIGYETDNFGLFLGIGLGSGAIGGYMAYRNYFESVDHIGRANVTYNAGLAQTLNVCVAGLAVVPCETGEAAPIVAPPPEQ